MKITLLALLMIMVGYFLLLYGGVGFMQDKRFFSSAPKENLAAIPDKKERFRGAHAIGWIIVALAVLLFLGAFALAALNGIKNGFGFSRFFLRFFIMLYGMELYDILFFDWVLLCHSNFFPHFYPELKGIVGPHMFGYNKNPTFCISFYIAPLRRARVGLHSLLTVRFLYPLIKNNSPRNTSSLSGNIFTHHMLSEEELRRMDEE